MTVPKGISWMGGCEGVAGTRKIEIKDDFMIGRYEVTQSQWEAVMNFNPSSFTKNGELKHLVNDYSDEQVSRLPVESVSWNDCLEFVEKLNELSKD
ncbi:MAG: formylglycine-generating enzyme family protein, partial [Dolichospermum sp.]